MSDVEFTDKTGQLPTQQDFDDALDSVGKALVGKIHELPPDLAVNLAVIHRCLKAGKALFAAIEKKKHG